MPDFETGPALVYHCHTFLSAAYCIAYSCMSIGNSRREAGCWRYQKWSDEGQEDRGPVEELQKHTAENLSP